MSKLWIGDKMYIVDEEVQAEMDRLIEVEAEIEKRKNNEAKLTASFPWVARPVPLSVQQP